MRCEGAFIGHAIASQYDPSIYLAENVGNSLLDCKTFDGSDILSRHLYLYHTKPCEIGEVTKYIYQQAIQYISGKPALSRESFCFNQSVIDEIVQSTDKKCDGYTAACGPAQRSYPLAFCSFISDHDLFDYTKHEAKLTHYSPLAGQVAGIVNLICRSLLNNKTWSESINSAFAEPQLHDDIKSIYGRHHRWPKPTTETHPAYAPTVLNAALHYVATSENATQAILKAQTNEKVYCRPIVGILAGARWGIPIEMYKNNINDLQLKTLRETASKLSNLWQIKYDSASA